MVQAAAVDSGSTYGNGNSGNDAPGGNGGLGIIVIHIHDWNSRT